jgi:integrase/recombinase XerC
MHVADIEQESGVILIHERKTGVWRKVPASEESLNAVQRYVRFARERCTTEDDRAQGFLYPQKGATSLRCLLNAKLSRECRRLHLKRITSHSFRHAAATHLLQSGAGIRQVQAFLGHQSITSTERYTHVVTEDLKAVISGCHPRETSA